MADFVADGFLRFDALIPEALNQAAWKEMKRLAPGKLRRALHGLSGRSGALEAGPLAQNSPASLTPLEDCYPAPSALGEVLRFPAVAGIIESLVGANPAFDHDFIHHIPAGAPRGQHLHVDAVLEPEAQAFDIQLFYFPTAVAPGGGGTRFVPGSHLRRARAEGIARYQHVVGEQHYSGPAGTLLVFHQGLWHAGQPNPSAEDRWMYKIRLNPRGLSSASGTRPISLPSTTTPGTTASPIREATLLRSVCAAWRPGKRVTRVAMSKCSALPCGAI
jgi:hypothetical protein